MLAVVRAARLAGYATACSRRTWSFATIASLRRFDLAKDALPVFTVVYVVRAVSPGRYVPPQPNVEHMYRRDRFARTGTGTIKVTAAK